MNTQTTRPQSATEILRTASNVLGGRGKQYDPAGKQERSMTAIVAAFNAIYPRNLLTVHMGWQFMSLVKMVRGATKPHADSALDQVAYAALAAEEVAEQLHQPAPTAQPVNDSASPKAQVTAYDVQELLAHTRSLEVQLDTLRSSFAEYACRFDLDKEYMTKEQVLAGQAKHEAQVEKLRERECLAIETINDLRTELASCKGVVDRLYSEKQGVERELEQVRRTNFNRSADLTTLEQVHQATLKELETVRGECISRGAQLAEARARLQRVAEPACAHNTDEPKAPRPEYVDPFDQYGDTQPLAAKPRIVGDADPARGGLAYPNGKPL
jgi:hypothetical protein